VTMWYVTNPSAYGTLYARVSATGTTNWYLTDMLGSVRQIVDTSGNSLDSIVYDTWGNIVSESNAANGDRFKYDSGVYDAIQQTYLFNARWLNPQSGRWESQDPTGLGPDSNAYRYVTNSPNAVSDPTGLAAQALDDFIKEQDRAGWTLDGTKPRTDRNVDNVEFLWNRDLLGTHVKPVNPEGKDEFAWTHEKGLVKYTWVVPSGFTKPIAQPGMNDKGEWYFSTEKKSEVKFKITVKAAGVTFEGFKDSLEASMTGGHTDWNFTAPRDTAKMGVLLEQKGELISGGKIYATWYTKKLTKIFFLQKKDDC
jgi:RHS repeat-associated protein